MVVAKVGIGQQLVKELRVQVTLLEADLLARSTDVAAFAERLTAEYDGAREAERTAAGSTEWREGRITQAAAAWVLGTVFVRFCEDNGLIEWAFIAGPVSGWPTRRTGTGSSSSRTPRSTTATA